MFCERKKPAVKNKRQATAFTMVEIMVAVGLLSIILAFSTMIFKVSLGTRRVAGANEEIMQKLRAITSQLNSDFAGLDKNAPLLIQFEQVTNTTGQLLRFDQVMFFATGDFYSNKPGSTGLPIRGNAARIYYGHPNFTNSSGFLNPYYSNETFARCQHILTADTTLFNWPSPNLSDFNSPDPVYGYPSDDFFEHDRLSLAQWKTIGKLGYEQVNGVIPVCFNRRTGIDMSDPQRLTMHNLMCEGVSSFAVQLDYWDGAAYLWYPDNTSHFGLLASFGVTNVFGVRFNIPKDTYTPTTTWFPIESGLIPYNSVGGIFAKDFYPRALKFTFTLHDSHNVIKGGRTFTHIVYIGD